jgi:hypothetical protein
MSDFFSNQVARTRYIPKVKKTEESIQRRVASYIKKHYSYVDFHSDYGAGLHLSQHQALVQQSLQSGKGWADMFIAWPTTIEKTDGTTQHYCGLFLELKREGTAIYVSRGPRKGLLVQNEHIATQAAFIKRMRERGYCAMFGIGYDKTIQIIDWYMGQPSNASLF